MRAKKIPAIEFFPLKPLANDSGAIPSNRKKTTLLSTGDSLSFGKTNWPTNDKKRPTGIPTKHITFNVASPILNKYISPLKPPFEVHACFNSRNGNMYYRVKNSDTWIPIYKGDVITVTAGMQFSPEQNEIYAFEAEFVSCTAPRGSTTRRSKVDNTDDEDEDEEEDNDDEDEMEAEDDEDEENYDECDDEEFILKTSKRARTKNSKNSNNNKRKAKQTKQTITTRSNKRRKITKKGEDEDSGDDADTEAFEANQNAKTKDSEIAKIPEEWLLLQQRKITYSCSSGIKFRPKDNQSGTSKYKLSLVNNTLRCLAPQDEIKEENANPFLHSMMLPKKPDYEEDVHLPDEKSDDYKNTNTENQKGREIDILHWPEELPRCLNDKDNLELYKTEILLHDTEARIKIYINVPRAIFFVKNGMNISHRGILFDYVNRQCLSSFKTEDQKSTINQYNIDEELMKIYKLVSTPYDDMIPRHQPKGLRIELYNYQLQATKWMHQLELKCAENKGWELPSLAKVDKFEGILFDGDNRRFYMKERHPNIVKCQGGILADEMGLGKTIELIGLIHEHPSPLKKKMSTKTWWDTPTDHHLFPSTATLIVMPNHLIDQWKNEILNHSKKNIKLIVITTIHHHKKTTFYDLMTADVVLVSFSFLENSNYRGYLELSSFNVVEELGDYHSRYQNSDDIHSARTMRENKLITVGLELKRESTSLDRANPMLGLIEWWRIIVDEGHEMFVNPDPVKRSRYGNRTRVISPFDQLLEMKSQFRWSVSGTPFPKGLASLIGTLRFLGFEFHDCSSYKPSNVFCETGENTDTRLGIKDTDATIFYQKQNYFVQCQLHEFVRGNLFCRRTTQSTKSESYIPKCFEEVYLLQMADIERRLYNNAVDRADGSEKENLRIRQLCCHLQISNEDRNVFGDEGRTLSEIRTLMVRHVQRNAESERKSIDHSKKEIEKNEKEIGKIIEYHGESPTNKEAKQEMAKLNNQNRILNERIKKSTAEVKRFESEEKYFQEAVDSAPKKLEEDCMICMEKYKNCHMTICGHLYCLQCIKDWLTTKKQCPSCRKELNINDIAKVTNEEIHENHNVAELKNKYGTKMARLITYINDTIENTKDARFIVFSQWDTMLHKIGDTLNENGIKNCYLQGNVFTKTNSIKRFKNDKDTRVMMLSLEHAASGTNLVEATHVLLIDPVAGTKTQAHAIESQAIGRAVRLGQKKHCKIVRFIVKDTVEYDLYRRNTSDENENDENIQIFDEETNTVVKSVDKMSEGSDEVGSSDDRAEGNDGDDGEDDELSDD